MDRGKRQGGLIETAGQAAEAASQEQQLTVVAEANEAARDAMPWLMSALGHLVAILLLALIIPPIINRPPDDPQFLPVTVGDGPSTSKLDGAGDPDLLKRLAKQRQLESASASEGYANQTAEIIETIGTGPLSAELQSLVGIPGGLTSLPGLAGNGSGENIGTLFISTGNPPGIPAGPKPTRIAYVIDASGSLATDLDVVLMQLRQSIRGLSPEQGFTVIFFQRDLAIEIEPRGMKPATQDTKLSVQAWLDPTKGRIVPGGSSNPLKALRQAMRYKPQLLYILSDNITGRGPYELDRASLLAEVERLNPAKATRINTIQFLYPDTLNTLADIAKAHGGQCKFVSQTDLWLGRSAAQP